SYHPNPFGHFLMANRINSITNYSLQDYNICPGSAQDVVACPKSDVSIPQPFTYFGASAINYVNWLNDPSSTNLGMAERVVAKTHKLICEWYEGSEVRTSASNLKPGAAANMQGMSDPVDLGDYEVGKDGMLDVTVTSPESVTAGYHNFRVFGEH